MGQPLINVQFVNYNTLEYLLPSIESVLEDANQSRVQVSINVLDNDSDDDISVLEHRFPDVFITKLTRNIGFGAGHNFLARAGGAPFILILNPDTVFKEERTLERLLKWVRSGSYHVVGPRLVTLQGALQWWDHGDLGSGLRDTIARKLGRSIYRLHREPIEVAWVSGACLLVQRDVFKQVGGFDPRFFLYKEEEDLCLRLRQLGHRIVYDPTVSVLHYGSVVASKEEHMAASEQLFIEKHCGRFWQRAARFALRWKPY